MILFFFLKKNSIIIVKAVEKPSKIGSHSALHLLNFDHFFVHCIKLKKKKISQIKKYIYFYKNEKKKSK